MTIVILAAGTAQRMGRQKLLLPIDGRPMVERIIEAAGAWPIVVVAGDEVAELLGASSLRIVRNAAPERGMAHSLFLANAAIDEGEPIAVLPADLPDMSAAAIGAVLAAYDDTLDVVVPRCGETLVHPVVFGPRARRRIPTLPDGDTLKRLRDDPDLRRRIVDTEPGALSDIDTPADYAQRTGSAGATEPLP